MEDSYYLLSGYRSGIQDVAGMFSFPLHCVAKSVCGQTNSFSCITLPVGTGLALGAYGFSLVPTPYRNIQQVENKWE